MFYSKEQVYFNFKSSVTIYSDFGAPKIKNPVVSENNVYFLFPSAFTLIKSLSPFGEGGINLTNKNSGYCHMLL